MRCLRAFNCLVNIPEQIALLGFPRRISEIVWGQQAALRGILPDGRQTVGGCSDTVPPESPWLYMGRKRLLFIACKSAIWAQFARSNDQTNGLGDSGSNTDYVSPELDLTVIERKCDLASSQ